MAKKSKIAKEKKIEATIAKYAPLRAKYKAEHNYAALQALPRNASPVRAHSRDELPRFGSQRSNSRCSQGIMVKKTPVITGVF